MKYVLIVPLLALGLAAFNEPRTDVKAEAIKLCMKDGDSEEVCTCQVNALEKAIGPENLEKVVEIGKKGDDAAGIALMTELAAKDPQFIAKMMEAAGNCK